uniref:DNA primase/helicase n=1 Tax=Candidatus Kentrum sp. DK TaxID=2126562 RepID=A0A450SRK6_9GAMM|nr:MAG: Protein of unknown function (DUF3987) [Candidatus Kentron sp. DK]
MGEPTLNLLGDAAPVSEEWPGPQPLIAKVEQEPYPVDALPDTIRAAVEEVRGFIKAPLPLVASSALGALSLACQAYIDIERAEKLSGPVGLFLLTVADSGERKSTCDGFFIQAIQDYQQAQAEAIKPEIASYKAEMDAWEAKRDGLSLAIKNASKSGKPTEETERKLSALQGEEPELPRTPRLILGDETSENLAWSLTHEWPSSGVMSSEAGAIFGSHGMGKDNIMRNLALLNTLWDGGTHSIGRRTSESYTVKGALLTMALQIQEATLQSFLERSGDLARGTGFLARFLVAWPESTQGTRFFIDPPESWPRLAAFHRRITEILNQPVPMEDNGALSPTLLTLSPEAKAAWVEYHDRIEEELRSGGKLQDVRDVASKSADNAARLAALLHMFERDFLFSALEHTRESISLASMESATRLAEWHLHEALRFFSELALPVELADTARLDRWLIEYCQRERVDSIGKNHVRRYGPGPLRNAKRLDAAISELADLDRVRLNKDGQKHVIELNPALLRG